MKIKEQKEKQDRRFRIFCISGLLTGFFSALLRVNDAVFPGEFDVSIRVDKKHIKDVYYESNFREVADVYKLS
jgi:hypothetical protein